MLRVWKTLQAFMRGVVSLHVPSRGSRSRQTPEFPRILGVLCYVFIRDLHKHFPLRLARVPGVAASIL